MMRTIRNFLPDCRLLLAFLAMAGPLAISAQRPYPPMIEGALVETYKVVDGLELKVWIFNPPGHGEGKAAPAVVFFFGGGWVGGSPCQFQLQAEYLAGRGMVAVLADYRVKSRHGTSPSKSVTDAKSAIRWLRQNASRLGVDPDRIAAAGGSAGGHLAASTALLSLYDEPDEDPEVSSRPDALALFSPVLMVAPVQEIEGLDDQAMAKYRNRFQVEPESLSPYHQLGNGLPPAIIFHGTADPTSLFPIVRGFAEKAASLGNRCELVAYEGEGHGFFNDLRPGRACFADTLHRMDEFLVSLGYIKGPPPVTEYK